MAKTASQRRSKKKHKHYQKKLTLYPMTLEQVMDTVLKYRPPKKKKKLKRDSIRAGGINIWQKTPHDRNKTCPKCSDSPSMKTTNHVFIIPQIGEKAEGAAISPRNGVKVQAYVCPKCDLVELYHDLRMSSKGSLKSGYAAPHSAIISATVGIVLLLYNRGKVLKMRKLAREAVIFMLLTPIVVFVSSFAYFYHDAHKSVRFPPPPAGYTLDPAASSSTPASEMLGDSLLLGFYGFPTGLGLWVLYRVVRFAIKG